jgi:hypothetical protein
MTTTRERLERRWSPGRIVLLIGGLIAALLAVAAVVAIWWLPPVLAETPRVRFETDARITLETGAGAADGAAGDRSTGRGSATVLVAAGWVELGVGPFLPENTATILSPDAVYRAELGVTTESPDAVLAALFAAHDLASVADAVSWSEETLTSGLVVRYADVADGDDTVTVAIVSSPPGEAITASRVSLTLVAIVPEGEAHRYRTITADLAASVVLSDTGLPSPGPTPDSIIGGAGSAPVPRGSA